MKFTEPIVVGKYTRVSHTAPSSRCIGTIEVIKHWNIFVFESHVYVCHLCFVFFIFQKNKNNNANGHVRSRSPNEYVARINYDTYVYYIRRVETQRKPNTRRVDGRVTGRHRVPTHAHSARIGVLFVAAKIDNILLFRLLCWRDGFRRVLRVHQRQFTCNDVYLTYTPSLCLYVTHAVEWRRTATRRFEILDHSTSRTNRFCIFLQRGFFKFVFLLTRLQGSSLGSLSIS